MRTLRARLLVGTALGTAVVLLLSGVVLHTLIEGALWDAFDQSLATKVRSLAAMMEQEDGKLELEFDEANLPEFMPSEEAEFYQVWLGDTEVRARSPSLKGLDLACIHGSPEEPAYESVVLPDGRAGRIAGIRFTPRRDDDDDQPGAPLTVTMVMGRATAGIEATLVTLRLIMIVVGLAAVLVCAAVLADSVRRGLRPVGHLAAQIAGVGESDLSTRIESAGVPAELLPVVDRLNDLLTRLELAFGRERRFSADVAHELRTPLAGVRSKLEVALSKEREPDAYRAAMEDCLGINRRMHQMVENLLGLARADAHQLEVARDRVDVAALVRECWQPLSADASARHLDVDWRLQEPCVVVSDQAKLRLVLQNILGNAVAYTNEGGRISINAASHDGQAELTVANTGSKIDASDIEHAFDRFWRGDASRRATGRHCGLGLSLCKALVGLLGGKISASSSAGGTFTVSLTLNNA